MYRKVLWIAAIAFSAFSATAIAAEGDSPRYEATQQEERVGGSAPPGGEMQDPRAQSNLPSFSEADTDNDGLIDPDEASDAGLGFSGADRNSDGNLQLDEYQTATGNFEN